MNETIRLACGDCDRSDFDGVSQLPVDWESVEEVQTLDESRREVDFDDQTRSPSEWYTHLGTCPDCQKVTNEDCQPIEAFHLARQLMSVPRANEILAWKNWQHGGVLGGAPRPKYSEMTDEENEAIKRLWLTLDGSASWMTALYMIRNDHRPK